MPRHIRQLLALVVTVTVLCGLPWTATALLEWPTLDYSWTSLQAHLRNGRPPPGVGTAVLIAALWAVWALYLAAVTVEIAARLRGHPVRLRLLGPLQVVAATAIGASFTVPAAHATVAAPPAAQVSVPDAQPSTLSTSTGADGLLDGASSTGLVERKRVVDGFGYDSDRLTEEMTADLEPVVRMIRDHGATTVPIVVTGHTDAAGDPDYNRELAERRADSVADFLRAQLGDTAQAVRTLGVGAEQLLDDADDPAQRRVEVAYTLTTRPSPAPVTPDPEQTAAPRQETGQGGEERRIVVLELPSGLLLTTVALGGVGGGFALGRRLRGGNPSQHRTRLAHSSADVSATTDGDDTPRTGEGGPARSVGPHTVADLATGIGITGNGSHDAARGILAAALETTSGAPPLRLVIPADDLALLIGDDGPAVLAERHVDAITVVDSLSDAITLLYAELLTSLSDDDELDPPDDETETHPAPFLLLASPDPEHTPEIQALLRQATRSAITVVLLGPWPPGGTCTISDAHIVTAASPPLEHLQGAHWPGSDQDSVRSLLFDRYPARLHRDDRDAAPTSNESQPVRQEATAQQPTADPVVTKDEARPVALNVLGRVTLTVRGRLLVLRRHSGFEVAAYLATRPEGVRLDRAVEDMWPGDSPHKAIRRFHDASSAIRTATRALLTDEDDVQVVLYENSLYRLNPRVVGVDLWELDTAITQADEDVSLLARQQLRRAVADYGDFAAEAGYAWAEETRVHLRCRVLDALLRCATSSDHDEALALLTRAVAIDPHNDEAVHTLIRLHLDHDDLHAATRIYRDHELALRRIDADPSDRVRGLINSAERSA